MFAAISLTNPFLLGGLALLSLPIIAHLLNRGSHRVYYFPSIQLLRETYATQARINKLRRRKLLLLRCLLVACVVAAFARPVWRTAAASNLAKPNQDSTVVVLLDASASMQQLQGGVPLFGMAKSAAARTIRELRSGTDSVNVVIADGNPRALLREQTINLALASSELDRVEVTQQRADFPSAIALAGQELAASKTTRRLVIVSDLQSTNFRELSETQTSSLPSNTIVNVVDLNAPPAENISLSRARTFPARPLANQPTQFVIEVSNHGQRKKQVPISLVVDGRPAGSQTVEVDAGQRREVAFAKTLTETGEHTATFGASADGLLVDNMHFLTARTVEKVPTLIVSDDTSTALGTGAFFLARALAPNGGVGDHFAVSETNTRKISTVDLNAYPVVFVDYLSDLAQPMAEQLIAYIAGGGGVVYFCGEGNAPAQLAALNTAAAARESTIPWLPGSRRDLGAVNDALYINGGRWNSPLLREFDAQSQIGLEQVRFSRPHGKGTMQPSGQVLLGFSDGSPAMVVGPIQFGELLIANFSPSIENSDLGKYGAFVALTQMLAKQLAQRASQQESAFVGGAVTATLPKQIPDPHKLTMFTPTEDPAAFVASNVGAETEVHLRQPTMAGFYDVRQSDQTLMQVAVNVDPRESDLTKLTPGKVQQVFERSGFETEVGDAAAVSSLAANRGRPLWGWFLGLGIVACCTEMFLLGLWRR